MTKYMELRDVRDFEQCFESNTGKTKFLIAAIENLEVDIQCSATAG